MGGDGARAKDFESFQAFNHASAAMFQSPILVALRLGNVDMKSGAQFVAKGRSLFHGGIGKREGSVQAKESLDERVILLPAPLGEPGVLSQALLRDASTVA